MIKVGSDCSGVGAFPQALIRLGIEFKEDFACDFDYYARQTYLLNFGTDSDIELSKSKEHKKYADGVQKIALSDKEQTEKDITFLKEANEFSKKFSFYYPFNMYEREIPNNPLDVYMGSFPCQSFSLAGSRKGEASKKGILFYNGHEFIQKNKPRYFIIENVKGLLSDDNGKTFQKWIDYLGGKSVNGNPVIFPHEESVPYHVYYQVMNAKHYGVPQNRERIFIIGIRDDADNDFSFPKPFPLEKRLKDVLESEVDEKYFLSDTMLTWIDKHREKRSSSGKYPFTEEDDYSGCITARYNKMGAEDIFIGAIRGRNPQNPLSRVSGLPTEQMLEINENGTSNALTTVQKDNVVVIKFERTEEAKQKRKESIAITGKDIGSFADRKMVGIEQDFADTILANPNPQKEGLIMIPANNSKGYDIAEEEEDSINFSNPNSETRRGRVGKGVAQTLDTSCNQGVLVSTPAPIVEYQLTGGKWDKTHEQSGRVYDKNGIAPTIHTMGGGNQEPKVFADEIIVLNDATHSQQRIYSQEGISPSILSGSNGGGQNPCKHLTTTQRIRRLTPAECFRLMDFNPEFIWNVSDSQAYRQAGNSIVVNCLVELLKKLNL